MKQTKQYEYVDLGLPSGLKWAKCNVGATSETDYGFYFQWGDIKDKANADCSLESYKYYNGSSTTLTKYKNNNLYGTIDNKITLDAKDDAARANMGGDWRMPTKDELQELLDNTTNEWTQVNGVNGFKFTGSNGNSIFFPAAGCCSNGLVYGVDSYGLIWSSSLYSSNPYDAWSLYFNSGNCNMSNVNRYYGRSVRGVMD